MPTKSRWKIVLVVVVVGILALAGIQGPRAWDRLVEVKEDNYRVGEDVTIRRTRSYHRWTGELHGQAVEWYPNGQKHSEAEYHQGELQGYKRFWSPQGELEGMYREGHGVDVYWIEDESDGKTRYRKIQSVIVNNVLREDRSREALSLGRGRAHKQGWLTEKEILAIIEGE